MFSGVSRGLCLSWSLRNPSAQGLISMGPSRITEVIVVFAQMHTYTFPLNKCCRLFNYNLQLSWYNFSCFYNFFYYLCRLSIKLVWVCITCSPNNHILHLYSNYYYKIVHSMLMKTVIIVLFLFLISYICILSL